MDPANEALPCPVAVDVMELVSVQPVMAEMGLGPNGALVYPHWPFCGRGPSEAAGTRLGLGRPPTRERAGADHILFQKHSVFV